MPIAVIGNPNSFILEMQVDENDIMLLNLNQAIIVRLDSYKNEVFEASVTKIYPYMNERSKTFLVEARFSQAPKKLFPFMNFEASIILKKKDKALLVPRNYLIGDSLITLKGGEKRKVKTGLKDFQQAEIIQGLSKTDELLKP
jgi:HlyD family secretion protein